MGPLSQSGSTTSHRLPKVMAIEVQFRFNKGVLSKVYQAGPFQVTRQMISLYTSAIGETNPLYVGGDPGAQGQGSDIIAPPALAVNFIDDWSPPDLRLEFDGILFLAGYWVEPLVPMRPGDELRASIRVTDVYPKTGRSGPMVFLKKEALFTNQRGEQVSRVGASSVWRK